MPSRLGGDYSLPATANGLRLSFFVYRGPGASVTFDPTQTETWENTRDGGNSPWSAGFKHADPGRQQGQARRRSPNLALM
jgi:hypothetical protein